MIGCNAIWRLVGFGIQRQQANTGEPVYRDDRFAETRSRAYKEEINRGVKTRIGPALGLHKENESGIMVS